MVNIGFVSNFNMQAILFKILKAGLMTVLSKLLTETLATKLVQDLILELLNWLKKKDLIKNSKVDDKLIEDFIEALEAGK